uniref:Uncharacterized protein n=1 Tax=Heterorhabditis bacteriophora TaxID=37862 RepID=A0A1I7WKZ9_HETBA
MNYCYCGIPSVSLWKNEKVVINCAKRQQHMGYI